MDRLEIFAPSHVDYPVLPGMVEGYDVPTYNRTYVASALIILSSIIPLRSNSRLIGIKISFLSPLPEFDRVLLNNKNAYCNNYRWGDNRDDNGLTSNGDGVRTIAST